MTELIVGATGTVTFLCRNAAGVLTVPTVATVAAVDETGTTVAGCTATIGAAGLVTVATPALASVCLLVVTLTATVSSVVQTYTERCEVAGAFWFDLQELRDSNSQLAATGAYTDAQLSKARRQAVVRCEEILGYAGVERYSEWTGMAQGVCISLPHHHIRTVRTAAAGWSPTTPTALDVTQIAVSPSSVHGWWCPGQKVVIGYTHGAPFLTDSLRQACLTLAADKLFAGKTALSSRTTRYSQSGDGTTYFLDQAGPMKTGLPEVDAVLRAASLSLGIA